MRTPAVYVILRVLGAFLPGEEGAPSLTADCVAPL